MESKFTQLGLTLKDYSKRIQEGLKGNLDKHHSNASYSLWESIQVPVNIYGSVYTMEIKMNDYWKFVDAGRKPGKYPPINALTGATGWIAHKGIDVVSIIEQMRDKRRIKKRKPISTIQANKQFAFLVARKIFRKGIEPTHFYSDVVNDKLKAEMITDIKKAASSDIKINIQDVIKDLKNKK